MPAFKISKSTKIYVAGHTGLLGSALVRALSARGCANVVTRTRKELNLTDQAAVNAFFAKSKIDLVLFAAGRVGGIEANQKFQADFLSENLAMSQNVIVAAAASGVKKLVYPGSACVYPKEASQPIRESSMLTGALEPTNEGYAIAKIAGMKLCQKYFEQHGKDFIAAVPANLYGPGDHFGKDSSHVVPALIERFVAAAKSKAKEVSIWGTGKAVRDFLYVDDAAEALLFLAENYSSAEPINVGSGNGYSIKELAEAIKLATGFKGKLVFDKTKPDGMLKKTLESKRITKLGWKPKTKLEEGLQKTMAAYRVR